jgi:hypothetical protein
VVIEVGLIGYGLGGSVFHAPLIQVEPRLRLHAVVTSRAGQLQRDHPGVRVVASPAELLEDPAVELVVVAAPNAEHHRLAAAALRAGRARRAVVTLAGYPAPGLAGLAGAWLLAAGEARSWLGLVTLLLVVLLVLWVRNPWGVGSVLLGAVGLGWLAVKGSPGVVTAAGAGLAALLLVGGWRAAALHATRDGRGWARSPTGVVSDSVAAGQLLLLPAVVWRGLFLAVSTATMLAGGWLLLNVLR